MKEALELEAFFNQQDRADLAGDAGNLAKKAEDAGLLRITPKIEIPVGIRTERLKTGTMTKEDFKARFKAMSVDVTSYAQDLTDRITLSTEEKEVNLIFPTGRDLGLTASVPYREFLAAGQAKGYKICDPEVGLYLRVYDDKQPLNDVYWMAMEPITDRNDYPLVFGLGRRQDGLWLDAYWADPGALWDPEHRLAFSLPASEPQKF